MNIELTSKEYRLLLDMVYIGHWILNSTRTDDPKEDYDLLQEKLVAKAPANGMRSLVESWQGHIFPSRPSESSPTMRTPCSTIYWPRSWRGAIWGWKTATPRTRPSLQTAWTNTWRSLRRTT